MNGKIYMIPSTLGDGPIGYVIPQGIAALVLEIKFYIVENVRTARRYLKKLSPAIEIDPLTFFILDKHTKASEIGQFVSPALQGENIGVISEAGCPGVADPGADIISIAHQKNIQVVPLVGPSSIILALMASGMNGQNFAFVGYLPIQPNKRAKAIKQLESRSQAENQTQIFIETPYRNNQLVEDILSTCAAPSQFCIACDITSETEYILTKTVSDWKKAKPQDLHKRPCIFLLHGQNHPHKK